MLCCQKKKNRPEETFVLPPRVLVVMGCALNSGLLLLWGECINYTLERLRIILYDLHFKLSDIGILSVHTVK